MHLITALVTYFSLLIFAFAGPVIPTPPTYSSVTATHKPTSTRGHHSYHHPIPIHKSETHRVSPHTLSRPTGTYEPYKHTETHPFGEHTGIYEVHQSSTQTGTHSFALPTAAHTFSEPTGTSINRKPVGSPAVQHQVSKAERANNPELLVRAGLEGEELANALNAHDGTAVNSGCIWECFQITCECVNAGGKSALISKTLAGLALVWAAATVFV